MISKTNYKFQNWARNEQCVVKQFHQPQTEAELVELIKNSSRIRFTGSGHSWNDICVTGETLVNLDYYNKVLSLDREKLQVKVQPGIKLWQLNEYLEKHGLALTNLGSISKQSVAGAISTATHGSGINYKILGSQVEEFTLIKADGEKLNIHHGSDKDLFNMALVNLGCLGVISELTINVVPAFNLHDTTSVKDFNEVIDNLDEYVYGTDHFKLWWFPHVEQVVVYQYRRTNEPSNDSRFRQWFMDELLSVSAYRIMLKIGTIKRDWRRNINRTLVQQFIKPLNRIEKSYKVFNVPEPPLHREVEWAFDLNVAKDLLRNYKQLINTSKHHINFIQEIRFTKADEYAMSPCYGRNTMWLGAYNADNFGWDELVSDFEQLAKQYKGRPHWGKEFKSVDKDYLRAAYPQYDAFNQLRKQLDPAGKFENEYIRRLFA